MARRWTRSAVECYERGCICQGCFYKTFFTDKKQKCQMKCAVIKSVRLMGKPEGVREKTITEEK